MWCTPQNGTLIQQMWIWGSQVCCTWMFDEHKKKLDQKLHKWLSYGILKLVVKKLHFEKKVFYIYEPGFWKFWEKINFETFYAQNYSQNVCFRSILNHPIRFSGLFYMKNAPSYTFEIFLWYNKQKTKKILVHHILGICSWMVFLLISAKNQETFILTWILFFYFPIKLVLPTYGPFSWRTSYILLRLDPSRKRWSFWTRKER